jgi:hypothetical protein
VFSTPTKALTLTAAVAALVATPAVVARASAPEASAVAPKVQHQHTVTTVPLKGSAFHCGHLRLAVMRGTETETTDADLRRGVVHVAVSRIWRHVELTGSDGRTYRAAASTIAWDVLLAPDFDNPVRGLEVVQVYFRGGPKKSPGYIREKITFKRGQESDNVYGPCDFAG